MCYPYPIPHVCFFYPPNWWHPPFILQGDAPSYVKKTNVNQEDNLAELYHKSSQK